MRGWQPDRERCSRTDRGIHFNVPLVFLNDRIDRREAEPVAEAFGGEIGVEDLRAVPGIDSEEARARRLKVSGGCSGNFLRGRCSVSSN